MCNGNQQNQSMAKGFAHACPLKESFMHRTKESASKKLKIEPKNSKTIHLWETNRKTLIYDFWPRPLAIC